MTKTTTCLIITPLVLISLFFNLRGLYCGLPSAARTSLAVPSAETLKDITPLLKETRDRIYLEYAKTPGSYLEKGVKVEKELVPVVINGLPATVDVRKIHSIRSALLQSRFSDEQKMITSLTNINPAKLQFNPHFFQYGGVFVYSCGLSIKAAQWLGIVRVTPDITYYFTHPRDIAGLFAAPKAMSGILETLAIPLIFMLARMLFGAPAGITAAVLLAAIPSVSVEAHSLKPFILFFPLMISALIFSKRILDKGTARDYLLAGIFSGLSAGTMIFTGAVGLSALCAHFLSFRNNESFNERLTDVKLAYLILGGLAAFFAANPYWLIAFKEVRGDFAFLSRVAPFDFSPGNIVYHLLVEFPKAFGLPVYLAGLCGMALALKERKDEDKLLFCFFVPVYFCIVFTRWQFFHYSMPLVPVFLLFAGRFAAFFYGKIMSKGVSYALLAAVSAYTLGYTLYYSDIFVNYDGFFQGAGRWINDNIPKGTSINAPDYPNLSSGYPPFSLMDYRVNDGGAADYIVSAEYPDTGTVPFAPPAGYSLMTAMSLDKGFLGKIYRRQALNFLDPVIKVYRSNEKNNAG